MDGDHPPGWKELVPLTVCTVSRKRIHCLFLQKYFYDVAADFVLEAGATDKVAELQRILAQVENVAGQFLAER